MTKLGVIAEENAPAYERYIDLLTEEIPHASVVRLGSHYGFAMAVKEGLQRCNSEYCLVLQHDRCFCRPVDFLDDILGCMDSDASIRYVGFNTFKSAQHDRVLEERYNLLETFIQMQRPLGGDKEASLFPLLFWYDSNHIAHAQRYLEIYSPFLHAPVEVKEHFGVRGVKDMLLRRGDFIEDRFGQAQRNILVQLSQQNMTDVVQRLVAWYGCYLLWTSVDEGDHEGWRERVLVRHLRGRKIQPPPEYRNNYNITMRR